MTSIGASLLLAACAAASSFPAAAAAAQRQADVARLSAEVKPFSLAATTPVFTSTEQGGVQRVVARNPADARQTSLVRGHLRAIGDRFERRDFSDPEHIPAQALSSDARCRRYGA